MADDNRKSGLFHWMWHNADTLAILGTLGAAIVNGSVPKDADEKVKRAAQAAGASVGGKGDPADEAAWLRFTSKLGPTRGYNDRPELQVYLRKGVDQVFHLDHSTRWVRHQGRDAFEEWRTVLVKMEQTDPNHPVEYLTVLAQAFRREYQTELRAKAKRVKNMSNRYMLECWVKACETVAAQMRGDAIRIPNIDNPPLFEKLKVAVVKVSPKGLAAAKKARQFSWRVLRTGWFAGGLLRKMGLNWASRQDEKFGRYAAKLQQDERNFRRRGTKNGPWKRWTYRFADKLLPF